MKKINYEYAIERLKKSDYDIFHSTFDDPYFLNYVKSPFVITVHDLIPEHDPSKWPNEWLQNRKKLFEMANHIIAVSQNTKNELLLFYPKIHENKVTVIYHGLTFNSNNNLTESNEFGKYILYVGNRAGYKNFNFFVESLAPILKNNKEIKLICTGTKFNSFEKEILKKLGILDKVIAIQVDDNLLNSLYAKALLFVFPSLIEGFGLPILEAWSNGCPVALSDTKCFKEIAGDAAIYFNPTNSTNIRNAIIDVISNEDLKKELIKAGNERIKLFDWKFSAKKLEQVYKKVLTTLD